LKIILHIGTEKTGSTSIQNFLFQKRQWLTEKGIIPACRLASQFGRNNFQLVLAADKESSKGLRQYRPTPFHDYRTNIKSVLRRSIREAESRGVKNLVFSSEHLSSRLINVESLVKLKSLFEREHSFEIVCYLRRQDQMILGAQAESIKSGNTNLKIKNPLNTRDDQRYGIIFYNYEKMLDLWKQVFGLEQLKIAVFQKSELIGGDIVADFCSRFLGITPDFALERTMFTANRRLSAQALVVLANLNKIEGADIKANRKIVSQLDDFNNSMLIKPEWLESFYQAFSESNDKVARKYLHRDTLFDPVVNKNTYLDWEVPKNQLDILTRFFSLAIKKHCSLVS